VPDPVAEVRAANRAFYEAFESRNLDAMSDLWEHSERAVCTHPGWARLRGWGAVASSWFALFQGPQQLQFVLTEERIEVVGDVAWVSVDENLLGSQGGATVAALNVFVRQPGSGAWRLVCHHGSVVSAPIEVEPGGGGGEEAEA
jgi:ketosteroid isomerase-like protein